MTALSRQQSARDSTAFYEMFSLFSKATFRKQNVYTLGILMVRRLLLCGVRNSCKMQGA